MAISKHLPGFLIGTCAGLGIAWLAWPENEPSLPQTTSLPSAPSAAKPLARSPASAKATLSDSIERLEAMPRPLLRSAELTQLGYEAAGTNLDEAIRKMVLIRERADRLPFLKGIFTRIAEDITPAEAIDRAKRLGPAWDKEGYKVLVSQWTGKAMRNQATFSDIYRQLLRSDQASEEIKDAWLESYQDHPNRGDMLGEMAGAMIGDSPEEALAFGNDLKEWERQQFMETVSNLWASQDGEAAWEWISANRDDLSSEAVAQAINHWSGKDADAANHAFASLTDPQDRLATATALAPGVAHSKGTEAALAWADSRPTAEEQEAAHEGIYESTPRGIGAVLNFVEGLPVIDGVLPNTPAEKAGLRSGDRIVEVDSGNGELQSLNSQSLQGAVDLIRGEPGSSLRLRVVRKDGETEIIQLNRQQLILLGRSP